MANIQKSTLIDERVMKLVDKALEGSGCTFTRFTSAALLAFLELPDHARAPYFKKVLWLRNNPPPPRETK